MENRNNRGTSGSLTTKISCFQVNELMGGTK